MVGLVDDHDLRLLRNLVHQVLAALAEEIGVVDDLEGEESFEDRRDLLLDLRLPDGIAGGGGDHEDDVLPLLHDEPFEQHQSDVGLSESDAVAEKRSRVPVRDVDEAVVAVLLVLRKPAEDLRLVPFPFSDAGFAALEILVHRAKVDVVGLPFADAGFDDPENRFRDVLPLVPVGLEPILQLVDIMPDLDIELHVLRKAGLGEVAGSDKRIALRNVRGGGNRGMDARTHMRDVGLGVEFVLGIDAALDLA